VLADRLVAAVEIVWLEDLRADIGIVDKFYGLFAARVAGWLHRRRHILARDPAAILFTSGSEGAPKGVVLSHANLLANRRQLAARVDFSPADQVLNALPMFHSFGLTAGFLLPLLSRVRVFLYPSPLHYRIVPEVAYAIDATELFGTDTFFAGYGRAANPYDFYALRYVFAGAEPVREETRRVWERQHDEGPVTTCLSPFWRHWAMTAKGADPAFVIGSGAEPDLDGNVSRTYIRAIVAMRVGPVRSMPQTRSPQTCPDIPTCYACFWKWNWGISKAWS
jgi:acyl-CoA synthetase (AMP-forming)/AMP-acid ligase II